VISWAISLTRSIDRNIIDPRSPRRSSAIAGLSPPACRPPARGARRRRRRHRRCETPGGTWASGGENGYRRRSMSACFPISREPMRSAIPTARAPSMVAILSTLAASSAVGSTVATLCSLAAAPISPNRSRLLLLAQPSVPNDTVTPLTASRSPVRCPRPASCCFPGSGRRHNLAGR
jgi:hypothetical protein